MTEMLNNGTIPPGNSDIVHRLILGKTKAGEVIKDWKSKEWDGVGRQCCSVIECQKDEEYLDNHSTNTGTHKVYGL